MTWHADTRFLHVRLPIANGVHDTTLTWNVERSSPTISQATRIGSTIHVMLIEPCLEDYFCTIVPCIVSLRKHHLARRQESQHLSSPSASFAEQRCRRAIFSKHIDGITLAPKQARRPTHYAGVHQAQIGLPGLNTYTLAAHTCDDCYMLFSVTSSLPHPI